MRHTRARNLLLLVAGLVVGLVGVQLLWPHLSAAQRGSEVQWSLQMNTLLPAIQKTLPNYNVVPPSLPPERLRQVVGALGMEGELATRGNARLLEKGTKRLMILPRIGSVHFENRALLDAVGPRSLPTMEEAASQADKLVRSTGLLPPGGLRAGVQTITREQTGKAGGEVAQVPLEVHVSYGFSLGQIPVEGPGAKGDITLGDRGQVAGLALNWRNVAEGAQVNTRSPEEVLELLRQKGIWNLLRADPGTGPWKIIINSAHIAYWAEGLDHSQSLLEPWMVFEGVIQSADGEEVSYMQRVSLAAGRSEAKWPGSPSQKGRVPLQGTLGPLVRPQA